MNGPKLGSVASAYCTSRLPSAQRARRIGSKYEARLTCASASNPPGFKMRYVSASSRSPSARLVPGGGGFVVLGAGGGARVRVVGVLLQPPVFRVGRGRQRRLGVILL